MQPDTHPPLLTRNLTTRPSNFTLSGIPEIPFYSREFEVVMYTCPSAVCGCDEIELFLYMPGRLETKDFSFRIQGNATEHRFDLDDSSENSGSVARMLGLYMTLADWVSIEQEWRLSKAMFSFASPEKEFFSFWYNYRNRDIEIPPECVGNITMVEALQVVDNLNVRFPGFDKYIENRNQVLRALYAADLKKRPLAKPAFLKTPAPALFPPMVTSIGRNTLCLCGSGKKYKRCCGKQACA